MRSTEQAIAYCRTLGTRGTDIGVGLCMRNARTAYGLPAVGDVDRDGDADAVDGFRSSRLRESFAVGRRRRGGFLYWGGGRNGYGHVAIPTGDGLCWSPGTPARPGRWHKVSPDEITRGWGLEPLGWAADLGGVTVWIAPEPAYDPTRGPNVDAAIEALQRARTNPRRMRIIRAALDGLKSLPTWSKRRR